MRFSFALVALLSVANALVSGIDSRSFGQVLTLVLSPLLAHRSVPRRRAKPGCRRARGPGRRSPDPGGTQEEEERHRRLRGQGGQGVRKGRKGLHRGCRRDPIPPSPGTGGGRCRGRGHARGPRRGSPAARGAQEEQEERHRCRCRRRRRRPGVRDGLQCRRRP